MDKIEYPAQLVMSRYGANLEPRILVIADNSILESDADLDRRLAMFRKLDQAAGNGHGYTYTLAHVDDVAATIERRRAELAFEHGLQDQAPEPEPTPQADPLDQAADLARARWAGEPAMLRRVERAVELAKAGQVWDKGGGLLWVKSDSYGVWKVNGACECPDHTLRGVTWCKHRIAVALVRRAAELQKNGTNGADTPKVPELAPTAEDPTQGQDTTEAAPRQVELVVNYLSDEARRFSRIDNAGELVGYTVDGQPADPPTRRIEDLYRWLQAHDYTPAGFTWLDKGTGGNRRRRQVYTAAA